MPGVVIHRAPNNGVQPTCQLRELSIGFDGGIRVGGTQLPPEPLGHSLQAEIVSTQMQRI